MVSKESNGFFAAARTPLFLREKARVCRSFAGFMGGREYKKTERDFVRRDAHRHSQTKMVVETCRGYVNKKKRKNVRWNL